MKTASKQQLSAINNIQRELNERISQNNRNTYGSRVEVTTSIDREYFWHFTCEIVYAGLPETNLLRAIAHEYFTFFIGKRGRIDVRIAPKSFQQFRGKKYGNWQISKDCA